MVCCEGSVGPSRPLPLTQRRLPPHCHHYALKKYVDRFFKEDGAYYKYNNGKYRIVGLRDVDPLYSE